MVEEDEQRLFTEKVNKTFSECLNLISEGCPKEEILVILNDLIKNIPDAKKLVKYWICLARIEPLTSPIENIITIYEKAILAGAQVRLKLNNLCYYSVKDSELFWSTLQHNLIKVWLYM